MILFISGTDTGCGKTTFSALLCRAFSAIGLKAGYQKWVSTGNKRVSDDASLVFKQLGIAPAPRPGSLETPYCLSLPASPHLAAAREGITIDPAVLKNATMALHKDLDVLVVEGTGGLMVPISEGLLISQLVKEMEIPVVLVARAGVGTINHTLLSIRYMKEVGLELSGLILNESGPTAPDIVSDNARIIGVFTGVHPILVLPYGAQVDNRALDAVKEAAKILLSQKVPR